MKKLLSLFSGAGLVFSISSNIMAMSQNNIVFDDASHIWDAVKIDHNVTTPKSGEHDYNDTKTDAKATAKIDWNDTLLKADKVEARGYFALHPYTGAKYLSYIMLDKIAEESSVDTLVWRSNDDVYQAVGENGWAYQKSTITLTIVAKYNDDEGITSLEVTSFIKAYTTGSVHSCSTTSTIYNIDFLPE
jgi:hypothetical protein